jgi:hypothetical protein
MNFKERIYRKLNLRKIYLVEGYLRKEFKKIIIEWEFFLKSKLERRV